MSDTATEIAVKSIDPLEMVDLKEVSRRSGLPRKTILGWLAADAMAKTPGRRFPRPLEGKKMRWHLLTFVMWNERRARGDAA